MSRAEKAAEKMMQRIDADKMGTPAVPREESIDYYELIAEQCKDRAEQIKSELREAQEESKEK